jgi:hypothetical protein
MLAANYKSLLVKSNKFVEHETNLKVPYHDTSTLGIGLNLWHFMYNGRLLKIKLCRRDLKHTTLHKLEYTGNTM